MNHFLNKLFFIINLLNNLLQLRNLVNQIMIKILYKSFLLLSLILNSFSIHSQKLSEKEFVERLNYERGNYAIQNYNQSFLDRPGFVWGILKSKKDNIIYMASNGGVLEYDGISVRRIPLKEDTTYNSNFIGLDNKKFSGKIICVNKKGELKIRKTSKEEINYSENTIKFMP